jgi:hypothetical protein
MILYEKRAPRLIHFICLTFTVGLTGAMAYLVFLQDPSRPLYEETAKIEGGAKVLFGFFILIGVFMTGVFGHRLIKNPAYFIITEEGFEYSPGGVSPGLIRWGDIVELREENVLTDRGGIGGPALELAVAVVLSNPEEYMAKYPAAFKPFLAIRGKMNSSPILMRPSDFGRDYQSIMTIMREQVQQHAARSPAKRS